MSRQLRLTDEDPIKVKWNHLNTISAETKGLGQMNQEMSGNYNKNHETIQITIYL